MNDRGDIAVQFRKEMLFISKVNYQFEQKMKIQQMSHTVNSTEFNFSIPDPLFELDYLRHQELTLSFVFRKDDIINQELGFFKFKMVGNDSASLTQIVPNFKVEDYPAVDCMLGLSPTSVTIVPNSYIAYVTFFDIGIGIFELFNF